MPKAVIYARKSTESEDRQVLSIDSQINELKSFAEREKIDISEVFTEAKSAKAPGRPVFSGLMDQVQQGQIECILCWKLDRLARNPVDGGALIWALEEHNLKNIVTPQRTFDNTGNDKFWMQLEFGMAKKFVDDLSDNVKRGMKAKVEQGWHPHLAPLGYLNDPLTKTIVKDPERFPIIRRMWDLMLTGNHTPVEILGIATDKWGLRTRNHGKKGGRPLARSAVYDLFSHPFYHGMILRAGRLYEGRHEPMVTKQEYNRVQQLLGRTNAKRPQRRQFAFTGMITCGECGASITAEHHTNRYGSEYTYYHCTKRKNNTNCTQRSVEVNDLEAQIIQFLDSITITPAFAEWSLALTREIHKERWKADRSEVSALRKRYDKRRRDIVTLLEMRIRKLISDQEFIDKKKELEYEADNLKERFEDNDHTFQSTIDQCEEAFNFAERAQDIFVTGGIEEKKAILSCIGSNLKLLDKKLLIEVQKPLLMIRDGLDVRGVRKLMFEPENFSERSPKEKTADKAILSWSRTVDDIRTYFLNEPSSLWLHAYRMLEHTGK